MSSKCLFEFDKENPIYYGGETVKVKVTLTTTTEKNCKEVYLEFKGEAKVLFSKANVGGKARAYRGEEMYINNHTTLHPECKLPPGTYTYNFDIALPERAPSSYTCKYGQTWYELSLVIDRPLRFNNVFRKKLTVIRNFNLSLHPELLLPLYGENIGYFCFWACKSGPIVSTLVTPFGGLNPGQSINYTLQIDNQSSDYDVNGVKLRLMQTYYFKSNLEEMKIFCVSKKVAETEQNDRVLRLSKRVLEGSLLVPPVPPTQDETIINVKYNIEMIINAGWFHKNSKIVLPITIGTVSNPQINSNQTQLPEMCQ